MPQHQTVKGYYLKKMVHGSMFHHPLQQKKHLLSIGYQQVPVQRRKKRNHLLELTYLLVGGILEDLGEDVIISIEMEIKPMLAGVHVINFIPQDVGLSFCKLDEVSFPSHTLPYFF